MKFAIVIATVAATAFGVATFAATPSFAGGDVTQTAPKVSSTGQEVRPPAGMLPGTAEPEVAIGPAQQTNAKTPAAGRARSRN